MKVQEIFRNSSLVGGGVVVQNIIQIVSIAILSRLLLPEEFGLLSTVMIFVNLANVFNQIGVAGALVQKESLSLDDENFGYLSSIIIGLAISAVSIVGMPFYLSAYEVPNYLVPTLAFAIYFPLKGFIAIHEALLIRKSNVKSVVVSNLVSFVIGYTLVSSVFALLGFGFVSIVFGYLAQAIVLVGLYLFNGRVKLHFDSNFRDHSYLLSYGGWNSISSILNYIAEQVDYLYNVTFWGMEQQGFYHKSFQLYSVVARSSGTVMDKVFFPEFSKSQKDYDKIYKWFVRLLLIAISGLTIVSFFISTFAEELVLVLFGAGWEAVVPPLMVLCWSLPFRVGTKLSKTVLKAIAEVRLLAWLQGLFILSLVLLLAFFGSLGIYGVAKAVVGATLVNFITMTYFALSILRRRG